MMGTHQVVDFARVLDNPEALRGPVVIVGGLPRSGTTFCQRLLNSSKQFLIFDEFPPSVAPSLQSLLDGQASFYAHDFEKWRNVDRATLLSRQRYLLLTLWAMGSDPSVSRKKARSIFGASHVKFFGQKTPSSELDLQAYAPYFGEVGIVLVYCVRHPVAVLRSLAAMPWRGIGDEDAMIAHTVSRYEKSLAAIDAAGADKNVTVVPFLIDSLSTAATSDRRPLADQFLRAFPGRPTPDAGMLKFLDEMPVVDHWPVLEKVPSQQLRPEHIETISPAKVLGYSKHEVIQEVLRRFGLAEHAWS